LERGKMKTALQRTADILIEIFAHPERFCEKCSRRKQVCASDPDGCKRAEPQDVKGFFDKAAEEAK
jgi:hypothetical protein